MHRFLSTQAHAHTRAHSHHHFCLCGLAAICLHTTTTTTTTHTHTHTHTQVHVCQEKKTHTRTHMHHRHQERRAAEATTANGPKGAKGAASRPGLQGVPMGVPVGVPVEPDPSRHSQWGTLRTRHWCECAPRRGDVHGGLRVAHRWTLRRHVRDSLRPGLCRYFFEHTFCRICLIFPHIVRSHVHIFFTPFTI